MRQRVDVDETLPAVALPGRLLNELCAHALETLPEECCGLILGAAHERYRHLVRCRNDMTRRHQLDPVRFPRDGREAFYMNELEYMRALEQAEVAGEFVSAVYHSHVGGGSYLSEMDLEYAENELFPFPEADQIVIAVFDGRVSSLGLFQRDDLRSSFYGRAVVSAGPL